MIEQKVLPDPEVVASLRESKKAAEDAIQAAIVTFLEALDKADLPPNTLLDAFVLEAKIAQQSSAINKPIVRALTDLTLEVRLSKAPGYGLRWEQFL